MDGSSSPHTIPILLVGLESKARKILESILEQTPFDEIASEEDFYRFADTADVSSRYRAVLCGNAIERVLPLELAQTLRLQFAEQPLVYLSPGREGYDPEALRKNGFNEAFLIDFEKDLIASRIAKLIGNDTRSTYKRVQLHDLQAGTSLDFDTWLYLPMNDKYVQYIAEGDTVDAERINRLEKHQHRTVYVPDEQIDQFFSYVAETLKNIGASTTMGETEKRERLQNQVRGLLSELFTEGAAVRSTVEQGKLLANDVQKIVNQYILGNAQNEWYRKVMDTVGTEADKYSHTTAVSTYSALFSIALGLGRPEDCATAGLFHDLGLAEVPAEIQDKAAQDRTPEEEKLYRLHPEVGVRILKEKKLSLPTNVYATIQQHHEHFDGSGFPKGYSGAKIAIEAQIVAIADTFDYLTREVAGQKRLTPGEAFEKMGSDRRFDPSLIERLKALFQKRA